MCIVAALAGVTMVLLESYRNNSSQCLVNLALMRHSLMAVEFGAGDVS